MIVDKESAPRVDAPTPPAAIRETASPSSTSLRHQLSTLGGPENSAGHDGTLTPFASTNTVDVSFIHVDTKSKHSGSLVHSYYWGSQLIEAVV